MSELSELHVARPVSRNLILRHGEEGFGRLFIVRAETSIHCVRSGDEYPSSEKAPHLEQRQNPLDLLPVRGEQIARRVVKDLLNDPFPCQQMKDRPIG